MGNVLDCIGLVYDTLKCCLWRQLRFWNKAKMSHFLMDITELGVMSYHSCLCDSTRRKKGSEEQPRLV